MEGSDIDKDIRNDPAAGHRAVSHHIPYFNPDRARIVCSCSAIFRGDTYLEVVNEFATHCVVKHLEAHTRPEPRHGYDRHRIDGMGWRVVCICGWETPVGTMDEAIDRYVQHRDGSITPISEKSETAPFRSVALPSRWYMGGHGDPIAGFDGLGLLLHDNGSVTWTRWDDKNNRIEGDLG